MNNLAPIFLSQKHAGAYYTPDELASELVAWAVREQTDHMLDPSCGDGRFLSLHQNSTGIEQDPRSVEIAKARANRARVVSGDFFEFAESTEERFDCAAGNPPFIRYQTFKGEVRRRALAHCASHGVLFSGLTSSWAPFLVATAALLRPGGRMAFVVPAEIGHAPYAAPLLDFLLRSFSEVTIVAIREKLFPTLSEDCWLLYAEGRGGEASSIGFRAMDRFRPTNHPPRPQFRIDLNEWRGSWGRRLRPYLLPTEVRTLYRDLSDSSDSHRFGDFAEIGIGYVSGDNDFFHLRPSQVESLQIPAEFLIPSVLSAKALRGRINFTTVQTWRQNDEQMLLLRLPRDRELPTSVEKYLESEAGRAARERYKCRMRDPWYSVPDVRIGDYFLSYMVGRTASLVCNEANITSSNTVHAVRLRHGTLSAQLLNLWPTPLVRLSCELEGHALGGGMLKLEPREAARILFPDPKKTARVDFELIEGAITEMQRWRHYG